MSHEHCDPAADGRSARAPEASAIALVGRPNAGKSSLFNLLTGSSAKVGNFPGITVDLLEASVALPAGAGSAQVIDLPGLYSFAASDDPDTDEGVAATFLAEAMGKDAPLVVLQVIDATQLALGLRLTRELLPRARRIALLCTQSDLLEAEGRTLDAEALSKAVGVPVLVCSARRANDREKVLSLALELLRAPAPEKREAVSFSPDEVAKKCVRDRENVGDAAKKRRERSAAIDRWALHPAIGPLLFVALMTAIFSAVFLVADPATSVIDRASRWTGSKITRLLGEGLAASFLEDGLLGGAGTVLAFLPQIVILTVAMEWLDASGYLARAVFLVDRLLRRFGLGGKAFVPLLTAHACAVPAIAATRILRDPKERLTALLVLPLMTCSARVPTYALLVSTFFVGESALFRGGVFVSLYLAGVILGALAASVMRRTVTKGRSLPLVLEMPAYRSPESGFLLRAMSRGVKGFLKDVGTTILAASALLWVLLNVPMPGAGHDPTLANAPAKVQRLNRSVAARVGRALEPVTAPAGFDWRINVGLIGSFGARELMVGTMGVIFGLEEVGDDTAPLAQRMRAARRADGRPSYSRRTALALMAFFVLACQCMSTVAALKRETRGWKWPAFVLGYTYALAYVSAVLVYQVAGALGVR